MTGLHDQFHVEAGETLRMPICSPLVGVRVEGSLTIARIVGESVLYQPAVIHEIGAALRSLMQAVSTCTLVVDVSEVAYASSEAIAMLLKLSRELRSPRKRLVLCGVQPLLFDTIRLMRLTVYFEFATDIHAARVRFESATPPLEV